MLEKKIKKTRAPRKPRRPVLEEIKKEKEETFAEVELVSEGDELSQRELDELSLKKLQEDKEREQADPDRFRRLRG